MKIEYRTQAQNAGLDLIDADQTTISDLQAQLTRLLASVEAAKACAAAMKKSVDEGCTDHLDCCDDHGKFWYDAIDGAKAALADLEKHGDI